MTPFVVPQKSHDFPGLFWNIALLHRNRKSVIQTFKRKIDIQFERSNYLIKTINSGAELRQVLRLRYEVFGREYQGKWIPFGMDWEYLDPIADHLVIIDKTKNRIVGTYRMISSQFSNQFYCESEFNISHILKSPGTKIEMSRACIDKQYRTGVVLALLWRGISKYIQATQAEIVFGAASVKTLSLSEESKLTKSLQEQGHCFDSEEITPLAQYSHQAGYLKMNKPIVSVEIPALLAAYLKAGAKVYTKPAWDYDFKCIDYFTVLEVKKMEKSFQRRYVA